MDLFFYMLIAAVAVVSGSLVFILMRFKRESYDDIDALLKQKKQIIVELELKLQETQKEKTVLTTKISSCEEQLQSLQYQLSIAQEQSKKVSITHQAELTTLRDQIAQLETKIKNYEEDVEDLEDEIDSLTKKLKKKNDEIEELDEHLRTATKKNKELEEKIISLSDQIDTLQNKIAIKEESLSFVQEVLQAEKASDGNELEIVINRFVDFIKGELSEVLHARSNMQIDEASLYKWALAAKKTWLKNKTAIAFIGEFNAGKTSIVNRILSQDNKNILLLPVSTKATTAIPTYISGGITTTYQFYSPDNILKSISETTFKKVTKEVLNQVEGLSSLITYFVMKYKNPNLDKLSILDTPGFNSNDIEDARRTIDVINECDALFWVFDVNAGAINRSSLQIIKEHLSKPLYIVINKVDTKSKTEVDSVETLIKKTLESEGIKVVSYIRFSENQEYKLDLIMNPIRNIMHGTSTDAFINELKENIICLKDQWLTKTKEASSEYNTLCHQHDDIVDKYRTGQTQLINACENAISIPHYETYFLRSDRYEMSEAEYAKLKAILVDIKTTKSQNIASLYDESTRIVNDKNDAYDNKLEAEQALKELSEMLEKFNDYNNAYQKVVRTVSNKK